MGNQQRGEAKLPEGEKDGGEGDRTTALFSHETQAPTFLRAKAHLRLRASASSEAPLITDVPKGYLLKVVKTEGEEWLYVAAKDVHTDGTAAGWSTRSNRHRALFTRVVGVQAEWAEQQEVSACSGHVET